MIIKATQDDYIDIRLRLKDNGKVCCLKDNEILQLCSTMRNEDGEYDLIINSSAKDEEDKYVFELFLRSHKILPGTYSFEVNLIVNENENIKVCISPKEDNTLIITPKEVD